MPSTNSSASDPQAFSPDPGPLRIRQHPAAARPTSSARAGAPKPGAGPSRRTPVVLAAILLLLTAPAFAQKVSSKPRPGARYLTQPGGDPYSGGTDWANLPPWRQTSFFGVRSKGQFFIYVVDCSGSMGDEARLVRAKAELRRTINAMRYPQRFQVIFYNDEPFTLPAAPQSADAKGKQAAMNAFSLVDADGPTDPRTAMRLALGQRPDAVFLLSDGEYPEGCPEAISRANPNHVPIHCIDLSGGSAGADLRRIASESGGQYAAR